MSFINEYVSEEDIQKYQLDDLWNYYEGKKIMPDSRIESGLKFKWTIDREINSWLYSFGVIYSSDDKYSRSGRPEPTGEYVFFLFWKKNLIEFRLTKSEEKSSIKFIENPFYIVWEMASSHYVSKGEKLEETDILNILKKALTIFGYGGIRKQITNTVVEFEF